MGIDNDAILMFGFFVDRNLTLEWLQKLAPTEDEDVDPEEDELLERFDEDPDENELLERADFIKFALTADDQYMFGVGTASPYYDADPENQTYFFGIVFNRIEAVDMLVLANYQAQPNYTQIAEIARRLGASDPPAIYAIPHVF